eukprot:12889564-Prorocentrum_lima.AAC.1
MPSGRSDDLSHDLQEKLTQCRETSNVAEYFGENVLGVKNWNEIRARCISKAAQYPANNGQGSAERHPA